MSARSYLYVPGDQPEMLGKAASRGADAVIVDLEDAVALDRKTAARQAVTEWLAGGDVPAEVWVRVNADSVADDIGAVVAPGVRGISVAKATRELVDEADTALARAEAERGLEPGAVEVMPLIETAAAVLDLARIAAGPRVVRLAIGEADLTAELGMTPSPGEPELLALRVQLVVVSTAAGLDPPVGPVSTDFRDLEALRASTQDLVRLGFRARAAIHPAQVAVINEVLAPAAEEIARARALVERFEAGGQGATTDADGRMIDRAVIRAAEDVLARAERPG